MLIVQTSRYPRSQLDDDLVGVAERVVLRDAVGQPEHRRGDGREPVGVLPLQLRRRGDQQAVRGHRDRGGGSRGVLREPGDQPVEVLGFDADCWCGLGHRFVPCGFWVSFSVVQVLRRPHGGCGGVAAWARPAVKLSNLARSASGSRGCQLLATRAGSCPATGGLRSPVAMFVPGTRLVSPPRLPSGGSRPPLGRAGALGVPSRRSGLSDAGIPWPPWRRPPGSRRAHPAVRRDPAAVAAGSDGQLAREACRAGGTREPPGSCAPATRRRSPLRSDVPSLSAEPATGSPAGGQAACRQPAWPASCRPHLWRRRDTPARPSPVPSPDPGPLELPIIAHRGPATSGNHEKPGAGAAGGISICPPGTNRRAGGSTGMAGCGAAGRLNRSAGMTTCTVTPPPSVGTMCTVRSVPAREPADHEQAQHARRRDVQPLAGHQPLVLLGELLRRHPDAVVDHAHHAGAVGQEARCAP